MTAPVLDLCPPASGLRKGDVITTDLLPTYRGPGRVDYLYRFKAGADCVFVAFILPDGTPESTTYLAESRIDLIERGPAPSQAVCTDANRSRCPLLTSSPSACCVNAAR